MECPLLKRENAEVLVAYSAGKTDSETSRVLDSHVEQCAACREFAQAQGLVWKVLEAWEAAPVSLDFDRRLYRRIEDERQTGWLSRLLRPLTAASLPVFLRPALPLAAVSVVLLAVFLIQSAPPRNDFSPQIRAEKVDVEKVESALEDLDMLQQFSVVPATEEDDAVKSL
jgi:hypothetical protein